MSKGCQELIKPVLTGRLFESIQCSARVVGDVENITYILAYNKIIGDTEVQLQVSLLLTADMQGCVVGERVQTQMYSPVSSGETNSFNVSFLNTYVDSTDYENLIKGFVIEAQNYVKRIIYEHLRYNISSSPLTADDMRSIAFGVERYLAPLGFVESIRIQPFQGKVFPNGLNAPVYPVRVRLKDKVNIDMWLDREYGIIILEYETPTYKDWVSFHPTKGTSYPDLISVVADFIKQLNC